MVRHPDRHPKEPKTDNGADDGTGRVITMVIASVIATVVLRLCHWGNREASEQRCYNLNAGPIGHDQLALKDVKCSLS